jgi:hypothetical protein
MKKTVGSLRKVTLALVLAVSAVGVLVNVAGAANTCNVPRIPRTDQEEATYKPKGITAASLTANISLLARGRSQERESPTIPDGPFMLSDRRPLVG